MNKKQKLDLAMFLLLIVVLLAACNATDDETGAEVIETSTVLIHTDDDRWLECQSNGMLHSLVIVDCKEVEKD